MKFSVTQTGLLILTAESQAETLQLNKLLNRVSLTVSAAIESAKTVENLQETHSISLQLQTSKEARVAEIAEVKVAPEVTPVGDAAVTPETPEATLEVTPVPPVTIAVVVVPPKPQL